MDRRKLAEVDYLASKVTELSMHYHFVDFLAEAAIYRGWARSVSDDTTEGIAWIEQGISDSGDRFDGRQGDLISRPRSGD